MKRMVTWVLSTISIVVLLFGYHTSTRDAQAGTTETTTSPTTTPQASNTKASSPRTRRSTPTLFRSW